MAQYKIYGRESFLRSKSDLLSDAIHRASIEALGLPEDKRFHRFLPMEPWQFIHPSDRTDQYIIIEIMMFEGRPEETVKVLFRQIAENIVASCGIATDDLEIVLTESPRRHWFIRGFPGDELELNYRVEHSTDAIS